MPTLAAFLNLFLAVALLIAAVYGLRALWLRAVPGKVLAWLIAPGVAVHELSHAAACLLTGAKVHSITLFRPDGSGEVRHGEPKLKYIGSVIISFAPLAGGTLALWGLGVLLKTPVNFYTVTSDHLHVSQAGFLVQMTKVVWNDMTLAAETARLTDWRTYVFFYFAMAFTLGMAPSRQDLKNSSVGLAVLAGLVLVAHLIVDRLLQAQADGPVFQVLANALAKMHYPFAICALSLVLCGVVYLAGMPFRSTRPKGR